MLYGRTPIIALPYSEKHKAQLKELMIDYDNGNIYVVSAHDKEIIFDITSKIRESLDNLNADNFEIEIEGIGLVNLTTVINRLLLHVEDTVQAVEIGHESYISKQNVVDNRSIEVSNNAVKLKGFSSADTYSMPRKDKEGKLEWIVITDPDGDYTGGSSNGNGGVGSNPNDGIASEVIIIEPVMDKLYLRPTKIQKSINLTKNCQVVLPAILDEYSQVEWFVQANSFIPSFQFSNNVIWKNIKESSAITRGVSRTTSKLYYFLYSFVTYDNGKTWLATVEEYNIPSNSHDYITKHELETDYYTKEEIHDNYYSKRDLEDKLYK